MRKGKAFFVATVIGTLPFFVFGFLFISGSVGTDKALSGIHWLILEALPFGLIVGFITLGVLAVKDKCRKKTMPRPEQDTEQESVEE